MRKGFVYLASASPRRAELLRQLGVEFRVYPADLDETMYPAETASAYVTRIAAAKAAAVSGQVGAQAPVLGADTAVLCDDQVLGKPAGSAAALDMLARLSGRTHEVLSAVAVAGEHGAQTRLSVSKVRFRATTAAERAAYCATREPLDKAGAYGIQGFAAAFVEHLEGSYSAVMGLPLYETSELLAPFRLPRWLHETRH
jgi:septum formation protein